MRIELTQPHEHAGCLYPSGSVLDIPKHSADWLITIGVAKPAIPAKFKKGITQ